MNDTTLKLGRLLMFLCFLIISQSSCFIAENLQNTQARKEQATKDLRELCSTLPPPDGFGKTPPVETLDLSKVVIQYDYKSTNPCEDTANHYKKLLEEKGWDMTKMTQRTSRGGMSTIDTDFRHGEYLVTTSCEKTVDNFKPKHQSLYCSWGLR